MEKTDEEQLQFAMSLGAAILTHNVKDFMVIHRRVLAEGKEHQGIIVSRKDALGILLRKLLHLTSTLQTSDMKNRVEYLQNW